MDESKVTTNVKTSRNADGESILGFGSWLNNYNQAVASWSQSGNGIVQNVAELSQEIADFSQRRLRSDMDTWAAITSCRNPGEFFECQGQFTEKTIKEYLEEANRVISRTIALMSEAATPFHQLRAAKS
jgi:hypothetical protein